MSEAEDIFLAVVDLAPEDRDAALAARCRTDEIRREVESLLQHDTGAEIFFSSAVSGAAQALDRSRAPTRAGPYELQELIGEGGMGSVYRASDCVAVKILPRYRSRPGLVARFARERAILATLSHPNIARFLDAGLADDGSPYLAMEYVDGEAIDTYCADRKLAPEGVIRLFVSVCAAIEYAHANLVVHRDIKPANILVTQDGQPKLLDFGIAKVLETDRSLTTTLALTLEYASPEQMRGERANPVMDVYSLGAVLHKLLTGAPPHALANVPLDQALDLLLTQDVPMARAMSADLAHILKKALAKEPGRRYRSVESFRADLERFLAREAVEARGGDTLYRLTRFARRRWLPLTAALAIFLSVIAALLVSRRALAVAEAQRNAAIAARSEAETQHRLAEQAGAEALRQKGLAETRSRELSEQFNRAESNLASSRLSSRTVTRILDQQFLAGGQRQALATLDEWLKIQRNVLAASPQDQEARKLLGVLEGRRCGFTTVENPQNAAQLCDVAIAQLTPLLDTAQDDEWLRLALASAHGTRGRLATVSRNIPEGRRHIDLGLRYLQPALARNPNDQYLYSVAATLGLYRADLFAMEKNIPAAASAYEASLGALRKAKSPQLFRPLFLQIARASANFSRLLLASDPAKAKRLYAESLESFRELADSPTSVMLDWNEYANAMNESPFPELRQTADALRFAQRAVEATQSKEPSALDTLAWAQFHAGQKPAAIETQRRALALLPPAPSPLRSALEKSLAEFSR
jgi:tetratricopeptide (TPR) repeat protein